MRREPLHRNAQRVPSASLGGNWFRWKGLGHLRGEILPITGEEMVQMERRRRSWLQAMLALTLLVQIGILVADGVPAIRPTGIIVRADA